MAKLNHYMITIITAVSIHGKTAKLYKNGAAFKSLGEKVVKLKVLAMKSLQWCG